MLKKLAIKRFVASLRRCENQKYPRSKKSPQPINALRPARNEAVPPLRCEVRSTKQLREKKEPLPFPEAALNNTITAKELPC